MNRENIYEKLNGIFREVFDNQDIIVKDETTASDVNGWDSLMHITLIAAVEDEFNIKFAMKDIVEMKNVGALVDIIMDQLI